MFSCESFKVFKNIYFTEHLRATASVLYLFLKFWLKRPSEWFSSISETVAANLVSKLFDCRNPYQHII